MMNNLKNIFDVVGQSMGAQMVRLNTIASNLANMESKASTPDEAFRPIRPVFQTVFSDQYENDGMASVTAAEIVALSVKQKSSMNLVIRTRMQMALCIKPRLIRMKKWSR